MAKVNTSPMKNPMPMQDPVLRARNFDEVTLGYDEQTALAEAMRCLGCKNSPCVSGGYPRIYRQGQGRRF